MALLSPAFFESYRGRRALYTEGPCLDLVRLEAVEIDGDRISIVLVPERVPGLAPCTGPSLAARLARAFGDPEPPSDRIFLGSTVGGIVADERTWHTPYVNWTLYFGEAVLAASEAAAQGNVAGPLKGMERFLTLRRAIRPDRRT